MGKTRVLITDPLKEAGVRILEKAGFKVDQVGKKKPEELYNIIGKYDVVIVRSGTKITKEVIERGKELKIIGRAGVGLDNIDVEAATSQGIIVMNAPEGNTISAAEHTIALMMSLARNIPSANSHVKSGKWERKKFMGIELYGKTLGIIGLGRIGKRVATIAKGLGMKIIGYDPFVDEFILRDMGIIVMNIEGLLKQADFISFHIPLTEKTYHMIGEKEFETMKDGVRIINVARGGIIDEDALYKYIKKGKVKGAALDVFEKEPPENSPLFALDQVIVTPHLGASTEEAQENIAVQLANQIVEAIKKKIVKNAVNIPYLDEETMSKLRGYLSLGEKMGIFLSQIVDGEINRITIKYSGEIVNYDLSLLRYHIIMGLFKNYNVNIVNAPLLLKEKKISIKEIREESGEEFINLITVEVKNEKKISVSGTILENKEEKIVKIDGFSVEAAPNGCLLICYNEDKPGIMGHIGTVLGKEGVNIASMTLGRRKKGGDAITVLNLDQSIDKKVLNKIKEFPAIHSVKLVII